MIDGKNIELYKVQKNENDFILITDNEKIITALKRAMSASKNDAVNLSIVSIPYKDIKDCDEFDIIENDNEKEYGVSTVHPGDDAIKIELMQTRLQIPLDKHGDIDGTYEEWWDNLSNFGKAYWNEGKTSTDCMNHHLDFWMSNEKIEGYNSQVFQMTNAEISKLLTNGFKAERILVEQVK